MRAKHRTGTKDARSGFTLLEILISIAIFAIGGVSILSLFLASANTARKAADANRAVDIATSVRSCIEAAVLAPPILVNREGRRTRLFPVAFPFASLKNLSPRFGPNRANRDGDSRVKIKELENDAIPSGYMELPYEPFGGESNMVEGKHFTFFPKDMVDIKGDPVRVDADETIEAAKDSDVRVFYCRPHAFSLVSKDQLGPRLDSDENDVYAFNFFIRKSVARSALADPKGGGNKLLEGLYVAHVRVFKSYDPNITNNRPVQEFQFTIAAMEPLPQNAGQ
jgi:prepilin-type N-terminal cleavage/methylation domain-containing protein